MTVKMRQHVEREIAKALITESLAAGYELHVHDGGEVIKPAQDVESILAAMFSVDEEHLIYRKDGKRVGWVFFVYGNGGYDVISDYTTNLEHVMTQANAESDKWA